MTRIDDITGLPIDTIAQYQAEYLVVDADTRHDQAAYSIHPSRAAAVAWIKWNWRRYPEIIFAISHL